MAFTFFKIALSALVIAFASWLSGKRPELAGFIVALPLVTLLVLPFSYAEYQNAETSVNFAKSIMVAVPLTLVFFVPFLLAGKILPLLPPAYGFWVLYGSGFALLAGAYCLHQLVLKYMQ